VAEINRGQFLRLGVAGVVGTVGAGLMAGPAAAALPVPKPQGDDVGFLSFGAVAEQASAAWYARAGRVRGFSAGERRRLQQGAAAKVDHIKRINAVLGPDAIAAGDFAANFPANTFSSKARALALGASLENLLVGVYLNGAAFAADSATRLLLGRLLIYDAQQLAWMRGLEGAPAASGLAIPVSLEQAGDQLDRIVTTPNFPTS
jgi:ferritin-like protein